MTKRAAVVDLAVAELGKSDASVYWKEALPVGTKPPYPKHWCAAFALAMLQRAGLTDKRAKLMPGGWYSFVYFLKPDATPEPGDVGYLDEPFQHHFIVESVGSKTYSSIDGNQGTPGVQRRHRALKTTGVAFFSITPLLAGEEDTKPQASALPTLRLNAVGAEVVELQSRLNLLIAAGLKTDGAFGPRTDAAVKTFQRSRGLTADGVVGKLTWEALLKP